MDKVESAKLNRGKYVTSYIMILTLLYLLGHALNYLWLLLDYLQITHLQSTQQLSEKDVVMS